MYHNKHQFSGIADASFITFISTTKKSSIYSRLSSIVLLFFVMQIGIGQGDCNIKTALEPTATEKTRPAAAYNQSNFAHFQSWDSLENIAISDNRYAKVNLDGYGRSTKLIGSDLNIDLPVGAHIHGLEITFEGRTVGDGYIRETEMRLTDAQGAATGASRIGFGGLRAWDNADEDVIWSYGGETDTWGLDLTEALINDPNFGYRLQVRNSNARDVEILIDQITVTVYYTPLFAICEHTCVTYYLEGFDPDAHSYNWTWPDGFELLSYSEKTGIINVGVTNADYGNYEICVDELYNNQVIGTCCRAFNYDNCTPSYIGDQVWNDVNANAVFDAGDVPVSNADVFLFDPAGVLVSTVTTDNAGKYLFADVIAGDYYVALDVPQGFVPVVPLIGNADIDSDLTEANGQYTTDLISVASGDSLINIDLGISQYIHIGDFVWEDSNGDGIFQTTEPALADVVVEATNVLGPTISTTTDQEGKYLLGPLPQGQYTINFAAPDGYKSTLQNVGAEDLDSDINNTGTANITFDTPGLNADVDAGFIRSATIGDFVWEDLDFNGLQDVGEPGLAEIAVKIYREGVLVDSILTDETGAYLFTVDPGVYEIRLSNTRQYLPTTPLAGDTALDSDLQSVAGVLTSGELVILSGSSQTDLDFGLVDQPSTIGGITWFDENTDGIITVDEPVLEGITVTLYDNEDQLIATTATNAIGFYAFADVLAGDYYIVFDKEEDNLFTLPNIGDDETDSDVTGSIVAGSTDIFAVLPGVDDFSVFAGYTKKASIGDRVWIDLNRDGTFDNTEVGLNDVTVRLLNATGEIVATTVTTSNAEGTAFGFYLFENIDPGSYSVSFEVDEFFEFTLADLGDDATDSDVASAVLTANGTNIGTTALVTLSANQSNLDTDAGLLLPFGGVVGKVFVDLDGDGLLGLEPLLGDVVVKLFDESQTLLDSTVTDSLGFYTFQNVMSGNYYVTFDISEQYLFTTPNAGNDALDSDVTEALATGSTDLFPVLDGVFVPNIDAGLIDGASTISGQTWTDSNADGIRAADENPLADIQVKLHTILGELIDSTVTNSAGNYNFTGVGPGQYYIVFESEDPTLINTTADQGGDDTVDDDVVSVFEPGSTATLTTVLFEDILNIDAGFYQTATIGDMVWIDENENNINDAGEVGLNNIIVNLLRADGTVAMSTTTAAGGGLDSGYYQLTNIVPGSYRLEFERSLFYQFVEGNIGDDATDSDVISTEANRGYTDFFDVTSGENNNSYDAGLVFGIPMVSTISGTLWTDENANGIFDAEPIRAGSIVALFDQDGTLVEMTQTDENGNYQFTMLAEGFYYVQVGLPAELVATVANVGTDDTIDCDFARANGNYTTDIFFLEILEDITDIDLGVVASLTVGDLVWEDTNLNGQQDPTESGIAGIQVFIESETAAYKDSTVTDENGLYRFSNIPAHSYNISFDAPDTTFFTVANMGPEPTDSDADENGTTGLLDLTAGGTNLDIDAGLLYAGSVAGQVFVDINANGQRATTEPLLNQISVGLFTEDNILIATTNTTQLALIDGSYKFENVKPGNYYIVFSVPSQYLITDADKGNDETDSDITSSISMGSTDVFQVGSSEEVTNKDAGLFLPAALGQRVWLDENMDGVRDPNEEGVPDIQVVLFRSIGLPLDTTRTDAEGFYRFDNLKQGLYFIDFDIPSTFAISPRDASGDEATDSDADQAGVTPLISLAHGSELLEVDCGIFAAPTILRSIAWEDKNSDGIRQATEPRMRNLRVELVDPTGQVVDTAITNYLGKYVFANIEDGEYMVSVNIGHLPFVLTTPNMGDDMIDSDIMQEGASEIFTVDQGLTVPNIDIGMYEQGTFVAEVWEDMDQDAMYGVEELPLGGISVQLYDEAGNMQSEMMTNDTEGENVKFDKLHTGNYYVMYIPDESHSGSLATNDDYFNPDNSDLIADGNGFRTPLFEINAGQQIDYLDAGFYQIDNIVQGGGMDVAFQLDSDADYSSDLQILVGPNPALYFVEVTDVSDRITEGSYKIIITDKNGSEVHSSHATRLENYRIDLESMNSGTYYMIVYKDGQTVTKQLLKITP